MIQLNDVSLYRGDKCLIESSSFTAHPGWHIGLTGRNGCGKSSLFALLTGNLHADEGNFKIPQEWQIAHMAQEIDALDRPAIEFVVDGDAPLRKLQQDLAAAEEQHDNTQIALAHQQLDAIDAYTAETRAAKLLNGLGFTQNQLALPVNNFSGGWRMRLNLAKTLMCRSQLLLLDEPTNHLDLDAILWLENWLKQYPGTLILISHDREFLDATIQHIIHIEQGKLNHFKGNYSNFEVQRMTQLQHQQAAHEKQQREIEHMQKYIDRFRAQATKARQAQSRIKALDRLEKIAAAHVDSPFTFHFKKPDKLASPLLTLSHAQAGYGDKAILTHINLQLCPDSRIGLLGPNGAGKSTLIKTLADTLPLIAGEQHLSDMANIGYFAQHQLDQLDGKATPMIQLQRITPTTSEQTLRNYLGSFDFIGDQVHDPIGRFSGGEKARLALALIIWKKPNILLLDEPTNHLDLEMRHALTMALQSFEGAVVLVSHDRHLLRSCTDSLLLVAHGKVEEFSGDLDYYAEWLSKYRNQSQTELTKPDSEPKIDKKTERKKAAAERQRLKPLTQKVNKIERQMDTLQTQKQAIETQLGDVEIYDESNKSKLTQLLQQQRELIQQLDTIETDWMNASEELDTLSKALD